MCVLMMAITIQIARAPKAVEAVVWRGICQWLQGGPNMQTIELETRESSLEKVGDARRLKRAGVGENRLGAVAMWGAREGRVLFMSAGLRSRPEV